MLINPKPTAGTTVPCQQVSITSTARLHFGFADLGNPDRTTANPGSQVDDRKQARRARQYGSIGLSLAAPSQQIIFERDDQLPHGHAIAVGPNSDRVEGYLKKVLADLALPIAIRATVERALPSHAGLGSGTQLALACATAACALAGASACIDDLGAQLARGARSGIGIATFQGGGFVVDGGRTSDTQVPPVTVQQSFPEEWPLVLVFDDEHQGLADHAESAAFSSMPDFPREHSGEICRLILLQMLPALGERKLEPFAQAVTEVQKIVGDFFAPFQGGGRFSSPAVGEACDALAQLGSSGSGQSSWGPTGYAFFDNLEQATSAVHTLERIQSSNLRYVITSARNHGASIVTSPIH